MFKRVLLIWRRVGGVHGVVCILLAAIALASTAPGCSRKKPDVAYSQATPEDVLASLVAMLRNGDVKRLPDLIYADSKEFRLVLNRLGLMLDRLAEVSVAVAKRFPNDAQAIKAKIESMASAEGLAKLSGDAAKAMGNDKGGGKGVEIKIGNEGVNFGGGNMDAETREKYSRLSNQLFTDPVGLLESNAKRLTVTKTADDEAAILFDGQPIPPVGLTMKLENGAWFIVLPLNLPVIGEYMPETHAEWSIVGSLIRSVENALADLRDDINAGKVRDINELAEKVGEKAFIPVAIVFVVYAKEMDVRMQRQRAMSKLEKPMDRLRKYRLQSGEGRDVTDKLLTLVESAAREGLDKQIRRKVADSSKALPDFDKITEGEFQTIVDEWLTLRGVQISLATLPADERKLDTALAKAKAGVNVQKK